MRTTIPQKNVIGPYSVWPRHETRRIFMPASVPSYNPEGYGVMGGK